MLMHSLSTHLHISSFFNSYGECGVWYNTFFTTFKVFKDMPILRCHFYKCNFNHSNSKQQIHQLARNQ